MAQPTDSRRELVVWREPAASFIRWIPGLANNTVVAREQSALQLDAGFRPLSEVQDESWNDPGSADGAGGGADPQEP